MITFAVSGLWHGAAWTYVVWGLLNGAYICFGQLTARKREAFFTGLGMDAMGWPRILMRVGCTFLLTFLSMAVFRAGNLRDAAYVLGHFWRHWDFSNVPTDQLRASQMKVALAAILFLEAAQLLQGRLRLMSRLEAMPLPARWAAY